MALPIVEAPAPPRTSPPAPASPRPGSRLNRRAAGVALAIFVLGRLPSFFEPHWYTDEAGYAATAKGLLNGKILYAGIWNNKPPLHLWTVALVLRVFGPSEAGLHLLTFLAGLATLGAVAWAAPKLLGPKRAVFATLVCALLLALPVVDAELAIPETLLAAPAAWAGAILLVRLRERLAGARDSGRWPVVAGLLTAIAIAYQQTALADALAFTLILLLSPAARRRDVLLYLAAVLAPTAAWLVAVVSLAGWSNVAFALAGFYVPFTQSVLPSHRAGLIAYALALTAAAALVVLGAAVSRQRGIGWAAAAWAVCALLVPAAAQQPYPHYILPAVVPVTLAAVLAPSLDWWSPRLNARLGAASLGAAGIITAVMAHGAGLDWIPPLSGHGLNGYRTLTTYYVDAVADTVATGSDERWQNKFDDRVSGDRSVAAWVRRNGLRGASAVIWSSDAWLYATAELDQVMPTAPIYNDFVLLGQDGQVSSKVRALAPDMIIVADKDSDEFPEIRGVLRDSYRQVFVAGPDSVWLRLDLPDPTA